MLEEPVEPESLFYFIRLTVRRFLRQTVKQFALGLVGILIILGIGLGTPSADASPPLTKQFASIQPLKSEQSSPIENRRSMPQFSADVTQQLGHSRVASSSLLGHRLTGSHLFTEQLHPMVGNVSKDAAAVAVAP